MSSALITAHGGSKDIITQRGEGITLGGIIKDTMVNSPRDIKEKHLDRLIAQTTGIPREHPIMEGIISATVPKHMKDVPELHKVHDKGKTQPRTMGQVPYAGKMY
jgi:hypothetical protein